MLTATIEEIKHNLVTYLGQLEVGDRIVIMDAGHPIAEIRPISTVKQPRPFGLCAGEFVVPDDFDDPLPDEILSAFEGK